MRASSGSYPTPRMARSDSARASATLRWPRAFRGAPRFCRGVSEPPSGGLGGPSGPPGTIGKIEGRPGSAGASPSAGGLGGPSRPPILINGELDEVVIGITEVHAGRHTARARAWAGSRLRFHAVALQQGEHIVDGPIPFETEVGAPHRRLSRAEIARPRRRLRSVDVDLLRVVDPDRRHVRAAWPLFPDDREAEPLVEVQRALEIARDDDPVVDALDAHGVLPPPLSPAIFSPTLS